MLSDRQKLILKAIIEEYVTTNEPVGSKALTEKPYLTFSGDVFTALLELMDWNYKYIIPPMLALIKEQHNDIEFLKQENLALQNRLSILEQKMEVLENVINNQNN